jgi:hypothetical protein
VAFWSEVVKMTIYCTEAVDDFLQDDHYWHPSDYKNKLWPNRLNSQGKNNATI